MKYRILLKAIVLIFFGTVMSCSTESDDFGERTKIALRDAANQVLLSQGDSTSLILPVKQLNNQKFEVSFNNTLSFEPSILVDAIKLSLRTSKLPKNYIVEVIQCSDNEVAYSYQMSAVEESTIIPCSGRYLPNACYNIELQFVNSVETYSINSVIIKTVLVLLMALVLFLLKVKYSKSKKEVLEDDDIQKLGSFYFYPEQNKLVKEAEEIALSKKECELLALFVERPNTIIKRDELTKRVWEDNGVFVGRSLDTYISKLRKKLQSDSSVKLTNVHGVGYKLEIL